MLRLTAEGTNSIGLFRSIRLAVDTELTEKGP
jgi:hypothetical protein